MYYLASAFSLGMLPGKARMIADPLTEEVAVNYLTPYIDDGNCVSIVGHQSTADVLSAKFGRTIPVNRANVKLKYGDSIYVIQVGVRLQEGQVLSQEELQNVSGTFWVVTVMEQAKQVYDEFGEMTYQ